MYRLQAVILILLAIGCCVSGGCRPNADEHLHKPAPRRLNYSMVDLEIPDAPVNSFAVSHNGTVVAASYADGQCRIHHLGEDARTIAFDRHNGRSRVRMSRDGSIVVSAACYFREETPRPTDVLLWSANDGHVRKVLAKLVPHIVDVAIAPGGDRVAAFGRFDQRSDEFTIRIWDRQAKVVFDSAPGGVYVGNQLRFSDDGRWLLAISGTMHAWIIDALAGQETVVVTVDSPDDFAWGALSPDGTQLITTYYEGGVCLWSLPDAKLVTRFPVAHPEAGISPCGFSQDANGVYFGAGGDPVSGESRTGIFQARQPFSQIALMTGGSLSSFASGGDYFVIQGWRDVGVWETNGWQQVATLKLAANSSWPVSEPGYSGPLIPAVSAGARTIVMLEGGRTLRVYRAQSDNSN